MLGAVAVNRTLASWSPLALSTAVLASCAGHAGSKEDAAGARSSITSAPTVRIDGSAPDRTARFVEALAVAGSTVVLAGDVDLDLSGLENLRVAPGVQVIGERSTFPAGPRIFTTTFPRRLFLIGDDGQPSTSDGVRISGIRIQGAESDDPFSAVDTSEADAVSIESSRAVEIDHCEIDHWRGSAIVVRDNQDRLDRSRASSVWVHDNFVHHNQHPTADNTFIPGGGHGAGYGVQVADGAYARIERNVFDENRHAIAADGSAKSGYLAYANLILPGGGINSRQPLGIIIHTHAIDMHGTDTCKLAGIIPEGDHNCGPAGEYMDVQYNTVLYTAGAGIHLRGTPEEEMDVGNNVFAESDADDAIVENESGLRAWSNTFGLNALSEIRRCDFDADGIDDELLATGATWWTTSSRAGGRWAFLSQSPKRAAEVTLGDVNHDGRCDVTAGGAVFSPGRSTLGSSIAAARDADGRLRMFGANAGGDVFERSQAAPGGAWSSWNELDGALRSVAAETNADGRVELFGVNGGGSIFHRWQVAPGGAWSPWAQLDGLLASIAVARNADGRLEIFGTNVEDDVFHRWQTAPGSGAWSAWSRFDGALSQVAAEGNADGRLELFGVNSGGSVFHRWQITPGGAWSPWAQLDGLLSSIAAARDADGRLEIFGTNGDDDVFHRGQIAPGGAWSPWEQFDGSLSEVAAETNADGRVELFGVNRTASIFHRSQVAPGGAFSGWAQLDGLLRP